jgi:hypothetical protein
VGQQLADTVDLVVGAGPDNRPEDDQPAQVADKPGAGRQLLGGIVGASIRVLRQRNGWTQAHLGQMMGCPTPSTVCAAEGHRDGRQRGFTADEVQRLAKIFRQPWQLTTRCAICDGPRHASTYMVRPARQSDACRDSCTQVCTADAMHRTLAGPLTVSAVKLGA